MVVMIIQPCIPFVIVECWYATIAYIMYDVSLVCHVFQITVKTDPRQNTSFGYTSFFSCFTAFEQTNLLKL